MIDKDILNEYELSDLLRAAFRAGAAMGRGESLHGYLHFEDNIRKHLEFDQSGNSINERLARLCPP